MTKQEVMTALECCISHDGYSTCSKCPYSYLVSDETPFDCSHELYKDTIDLLEGNLISVNLDKSIVEGK